MRRITLLCMLLVALCGWQTHAQVLNQPAAWPNASWTITGSYSPAGLVSDPTVSTNFSFDDDVVGSGSTDNIAAESPVIDLTAAHAAGETWLFVNTDYSYNELGDLLQFEYYDADASTWTAFPNGGFPDNAAYNTWECGNTTTQILTDELDISGFTATQLSGFKYRISYDDLVGWAYGFCAAAPTIYSEAPPSCLAPMTLDATGETTSTANLSWVEMGTATMWDIEMVNLTASETATGTPTQEDVTDNPYTYTGLASSSDYEFYVRADCGGGDVSDWVGPFAFTTLCDASIAPFTMDFETSTTSVPNCWSISSSTSNGWEFDDAPSNGNSYDDHTTGSGYFAFVDASATYTPDATMTTGLVDVSGLTTPMLEFYVYHFDDNNPPTSTSNTITVEVYDGAAWNQVYFDDNGDVDAWEKVQVDLSTLTITGDIQARFIVDATVGSNFYNDIGIDDIVFGELPTCLQPTGLTAGSFTTSSAELGWTEIGSATMWDIEIVNLTASETATGTPTQEDVTDNPYIYTGLASSSDYEFYVRADCGGSDQSSWAGPFAFSTPCDTFIAPWTEGFSNGGSIPNCWNQGGSNSEDWIFDTTGGHVGDSGDFMGTSSGSGGHFAYVDDSTPDSMGTTLITPNVDISGLTVPSLSFYTISDNEGFSNVSFSVDFYDGTNWNTDVYTGNSNTGGWIHVFINLSSYTITGPVKARFIVNEDNASGDFYDDRAIDDVSFDELPTCPQPSDLTAGSFTTTSAELGWTEVGSATMWDIEVVDAGTAPSGTPTEAGVTTNPYNYTGLMPSTDYEFYVRTDCGGDTSIWTGPYAFSTNCDSVTAPFTEGFESTPEDEITTCWSIINGGGPDAWYVNDIGTSAYDGTQVMYISWDSSPGHDDYLITPAMTVTAGSTDQFTFHSSGASTTYTETFNVLVSTTGTDVGDFTQIDGPISAPQSGWAEHVYNLSAYNGQTIYVAIQVISDDELHLYIDGVVLDALPACPEPFGLMANGVTTNSADLTWTEGGAATDWEIEYGISGFAQGTGTLVFDDSDGIPGETVSGLTSGTDYEFYVRSDCGGDFSDWVGPYAFSTLCDIVTAPFTQGFESTPENEVTTCWSSINGGGPDEWYVDDVGADAYDGTKVMYISWDSGPHDDYLITPKMSITAGSTDRFTFHSAGFSTTYTEIFNVLVSTTGTNVGDFTQIDGPISAPQSGWAEHIYDLSAYAGQDIYVAIQVTSTNQLHLYIDGVVLDALPSCPKPSALTANNVMATSASLGWTENGTATLWDIEIVNLTMGETPSGTPDATGVSNPYLAENLDPASDYEFYVRADCGGGDLSEWSQAFGFTTLCAPVIPDYFQNFDTYLPNCWEEASSGTPATGPTNFGSSSWVADEFLNTGSNMAVNVNLYFNNKEEWLISPEIDLSAGNHELNYMVATTDYANSGPIEGGMMGTDDEVQVLISEDGGTTWINLMTYNAANTPSNTGDAETIDLSAYTGIVKIAFWATEGTVDDGVDFDYDFFIDDFAVVFTSPDVNQGNCSQMQVSNNFENGYGMNEGGGFIVADDFIVSASTTNFSVESITGNFLVNGGVATMDVIFYTDNGGLPGTQIGTTIEDIVPTSQTVIGSAFGFDVYEVVLDLPTPVDFAGSGTQDDTTYWLQLVAVPNTTGNPVYWEVTTDNNIGNSAAFSAAAPIAWEHDATNPDAVFTIAGICTYVDCPAPIDLTATMTSSTSVDISWTEVGSATEWQIEYGPTGFTPGTGTVVADNDGTLGVSISGLTAGTVYDYYVISICSSGDSYATGPETFMTPVCDPSSQCDYTFTLTDTFGDGWNGAEMEVRQNGIAIATLMLADGLTADVSVPICDGIDFELYWSVPGAWDNEVGISITNPFGVPIYTLVPDSVTPPASLYTGNGSCTPPSCEQPLNLSVTGITSEGANLSWDIVAGATNGYIWYVFADGADPQTATPVDTGTTAAGVTTATADGLTPLTAYDFYVKADCDADGMSDLSGPISFDTEVAPPVCGGNFYDAGGPAGDYDNDANVTTVISPVTSGEAVTVTFTAFDVEAGWDVLYVYDGPDATYPLIDSGNPVTNGGFPAGGYYGTNIPGPFTSSDPSGALTFVFMSDPSFAFAGWEADVTCAVPPACPEPTDLMVTDIGEDSAQVTWAPGGSETEWEIEYGLTGFTPGTGTIISDTDAPGELISGLTSEMTYDVYVTAICGADISVQVGPVSFTTLAPGGCTFSNPGNNLENGSSNSGDLNRIVANDIMIPADESFSLETIVFNEFMTPGVTANTVDVYIYEDNAGLPGAVISTVTGVVPVSQTVLGNNFGYDVSEVVLDITPVTLDGQVGASTTYWIGLSVFTSDASNCFWENTTASIVGNGQAYDDGVIGYVLDPTLDGVYSFNGVCSELGVENHLFEGFTFYPNPVKRSLSLEANNQIQQVEVFNLLGQSVFKAQPNSMNPSLELGELQAGAYLMKVTINDVTGTYRLIKE